MKTVKIGGYGPFNRFQLNFGAFWAVLTVSPELSRDLGGFTGCQPSFVLNSSENFWSECFKSALTKHFKTGGPTLTLLSEYCVGCKGVSLSGIPCLLLVKAAEPSSCSFRPRGH